MSESGSPLKKVERLTLKCGTQKRKASTCNCDVLTKKIDELKETFHNQVNGLHGQVNILQGQLKIAVEALAEQRVILGKLLRQQTDDMPLQRKYPLQNENQLIGINDEINNDNRNSYIKAMSSLLQPAGVGKNLKYILSTDVVLEYNINGVQGKKSLKNFNEFYSALLESIPVTSKNAGPAEEQLRKAIQLQKKRHFKNVSVNKGKNKENTS